MSDIASVEGLIVRVEGSVATIQFDRPSKLNTMTPDMGRALFRVADELNDDDDVRVVILTATGERAFSAGSDVKVLDQYGSNWQLRNRRDYMRAVWGIRKPVIAAIRGYAIGGGLELALAADIRLASPDARFGAGEIKLGWHGGAGNTQLLPRLIGAGNALRMLLTADLVSAADAHRMNLVQEIVPTDQLDERARELAGTIAANAPIAAQLCKHLVRIAESTSIEVGLAYENDTFAYCFTTADSAEGRTAFTEKRPARFEGR
jgi:enoyl-CoA hydratase